MGLWDWFLSEFIVSDLKLADLFSEPCVGIAEVLFNFAGGSLGLALDLPHAVDLLS